MNRVYYGSAQYEISLQQPICYRLFCVRLRRQNYSANSSEKSRQILFMRGIDLPNLRMICGEQPTLITAYFFTKPRHLRAIITPTKSNLWITCQKFPTKFLTSGQKRRFQYSFNSMSSTIFTKAQQLRCNPQPFFVLTSSALSSIVAIQSGKFPS